jgi:hypothetical protein
MCLPAAGTMAEKGIPAAQELQFLRTGPLIAMGAHLEGQRGQLPGILCEAHISEQYHSKYL